MRIFDSIKKNPFLLAPMAGITGCAFRSFMKEMGCGILTTELISANGLHYSPEKTKFLMGFSEDQRPLGIQIFGERLDLLALAAQEAEAMGADFVDLNCGCPVPKVVRKGAGSALLKDLNDLKAALRAVRGAVKIPLTIKVRTGWQEQNAHEVVRLAQDEGVSWVSIHGRTRAQGYSGRADWDYIAEVKSRSSLPIIGNGDLVTAELALGRLRESGVDAVMIGRGSLRNPFIFRQSMALLAGEPARPTTSKDLFSAYQGLARHLEKSNDERSQILNLKKFGAWFSAGLPKSAEFRGKIFALRGKAEVLRAAQEYWSSLGDECLCPPVDDHFLMGGHG